MSASRVGRRVLLRPPRAADQAGFLALVKASRAFHRPWMRPPGTPAAFRDYVGWSRKETLRRMMLVRREDGAILGVFNLSQIFFGDFRSAYLGYWVGAPFAGQGYMTEGMELLLRYAFRTLKLHRVEANVQPGNAESIALVRRTGFRREGFSPRYLKVAGRWRDHERWAMTVEDFRSSRRDPGTARRRSPLASPGRPAPPSRKPQRRRPSPRRSRS
ncbi:MAG TPA: GNAT family protein [Myxococcaceae bacterium]|nr:GNAT family protein [Myxococcaceae bacterium]